VFKISNKNIKAVILWGGNREEKETQKGAKNGGVFKGLKTSFFLGFWEGFE